MKDIEQFPPFNPVKQREINFRSNDLRPGKDVLGVALEKLTDARVCAWHVPHRKF